jgi:hypothetical protein
MIHAIDVQAKMKLRAAIRLITILSLKELLLQGKAIVGPGVRGCEVSETLGKSATYEGDPAPHVCASARNCGNADTVAGCGVGRLFRP